MFDRQLLCIDCILSDEHKGARGGRDRHDMVAVEKAAATERDELYDKFKSSEDAKVTLQEQNLKIDKQMSNIKTLAEVHIDETKKLFKEIKDALKRKEEDMLKNIQALLQREQGLL